MPDSPNCNGQRLGGRMFNRLIESRAEEALSDTPVVLIVGPRRTGKTTLVRKMREVGRTYITLDNQIVLEVAQSDPAGFTRGMAKMQTRAGLALAVMMAMALASIRIGQDPRMRSLVRPFEFADTG